MRRPEEWLPPRFRRGTETGLQAGRPTKSLAKLGKTAKKPKPKPRKTCLSPSSPRPQRKPNQNQEKPIPVAFGQPEEAPPDRPRLFDPLPAIQFASPMPPPALEQPGRWWLTTLLGRRRTGNRSLAASQNPAKHQPKAVPPAPPRCGGPPPHRKQENKRVFLVSVLVFFAVLASLARDRFLLVLVFFAFLASLAREVFVSWFWFLCDLGGPGESPGSLTKLRGCSSWAAGHA